MMTFNIQRNVLALVFVLCVSVLVLFYANDSMSVIYSSLLKIENDPLDKKANYLVDSLKCKILNLDPFDDRVKQFYQRKNYQPCTQLALLTHTTTNSNVATLHVNTEAMQWYSSEKISCCYANITRSNLPNEFELSRCAPFEENVTITNDFVEVICTDDNRLLIYENLHAPITIKNNVKAKLKLMENKESVFSVLLMGIDSVSRLNFIRSLPNSHKFLVDHDWISLKGYNKVADNTYPNVMAFLTGYNEPDAFTKCKPKTVGGLDKCPLLWYDFRRLGYATAYAEDESWMSTFNLHKEGFKESPTDYYFRPYFLASATLETVKYDGLMYCTGPETSGERVLNLAKDFATTFIDNPSFGLFWMNSFSHNDLNGPSRMDDKIKQFLQDITNAGVLEKSFVIFLSDHGLRFGPFQDSFMGWLEDRLPFIYFWVPRGFIRKFPREYMHLKDNVHKLTTPYDLYMTLQHLLVLSGRNYNTTPSLACPKCKSLFSEIEADRSCEDVGIDQHWCSCTDFNPINQNAQIVQKASLYVLDQIHNTIRISRGDHICARFSLKKIVTASVSKNVKDTKYILLVIETKPTAKFEVTLMYKQRRTGPVFKVKGGISRTDRYALTSKCTNRPMLQKFCYCL